MRIVPVLLEHYRKQSNPPSLIVLGFAAYLYFMHPVVLENGKYYGVLEERKYLIQDDKAENFFNWWQSLPADDLVKTVLADKNLWESDLTLLPGFTAAVTAALYQILNKGMRTTIKTTLNKKMPQYES